MKTRMQPIGNVWTKLPRVVRDLATSCGKQVRIELEGEGTELDKTVLEKISDPLVHLVRNALDHGLETPERRLASGKDEIGTLELRAFHEGGSIIIEVRDDGAGLNKARILQKARERALVAADQELSDEQIDNLIFMPGFSTAEAISDVSGRGVGMDVVRTNIEKIGGTVELNSTFGRGSIFTIKIPLTLAIVSALIVESCGERFAIPQISVIELVLSLIHI